MKVPAPQDRPTLDAAHRVGWRAWLLQEWGIMLLAAALAVIVWQITAERVIGERTISGVRVELFVAEQDRVRIGAVLQDELATTTVTFERGTERAERAVRKALCATGGGQPVLRLHVGPIGSKTDTRRLNLSDWWEWPVDNAGSLGLAATLPEGMVFRIQGQRQGAIAEPKLTDRTREIAKAKGIEVRIEKLSPRIFSFLAPELVVTGGSDGAAVLTPDALDLHEILEREDVPFNTPRTIDLSFNGWLDATELVGSTIQPFVCNYRHKLRPPHVQATLVYKLISTLEGKETQNQFIVQLDPIYEWKIDTQPYDILKASQQSNWQFLGRLEGPKDILDQIRDHKDEWNWQLWVDAPDGGWPEPADMGTKEPEWKDTTGRIHWVTKNAAWQGKGVVFHPTVSNQLIKIQVRVRK